MPKFMMVYKGEATPLDQMSQEEAEAVVAKWTGWIGSVGDGLLDVGTPFGPSASVVDDGSTTAATSLTGYSIVEAEDLDAAVALTDGHPYLSEGKGDYAIDVFEMMPVPL